MLKLNYGGQSDDVMPALTVLEGDIGDEERRRLKAEIDERYSSLSNSRGSPSIVQFKTPLLSLGIANPRFEVKVDRSADRRSPPLLLELVTELQVAQTPAPSVSPTPSVSVRAQSSWNHQFLDELEQLVEKNPQLRLDRFEAANLGEVVRQIKFLDSEKTEIAALLMLAGYIELASSFWSVVDQPRSACYQVALRGVDQLFEAAVSGKTSPADTNSAALPSSQAPHGRPCSHMFDFLGKKIFGVIR